MRKNIISAALIPGGIYSKRVLGVEPAENELMPSSLKEVMGFDRSVHAQMTVCPLTRQKKGLMQSVCVEFAGHIRSFNP